MEEPMNKIELTATQQTTLAEAEAQFNLWRKGKNGRKSIPESLWGIAADLFHSTGLSVNRIAKKLRLNHSALKERISGHTATEIKQDAPTTATFIEMNPSSCFSDCVIELEGHSGSKMRLCFRGKVDPLLVDLGRFFIKEQA